MTKIDLTLNLPDSVAREAGQAGLLSARAVARLLRAEMRRQAAGRLLAGASASRAMSMAEIQSEVDAVRKMRRSGARANG